MEVSPAFRNASTRRNEFFTKLKPCCVEISRLAMRDGDISSSKEQLIKLTDQLYGILASQVNYDASALDSKIAEYVFFPLSFIYKARDQLPNLLIENATKCLRLLIQHGWKYTITKELSQQLLILLTVIVGGVPGQEKRVDVPEETLLEGYRTLTALIKAAGAISQPTSPLVETSAIPALGHSVTVILDAVTEGLVPDIQLEALDAIQSLFTTIRDQEALASFLPGTVSSIARILSPPVSGKSQKRVLIKGLYVLRDVLANTIGDLPTRHIQKQVTSVPENQSDTGKALTPAWLKATTSQVKLALATVLKLRAHESVDVLRAVERFCISLLDECHTSLADSTDILVESAIISSGVNGDNSATITGLRQFEMNASHGLTTDTKLEDLSGIYPELGSIITSIVRNWVTSLPIAMQSSDDGFKHHAIQNIRKGSNMIKILRLDLSEVERILPISLRDSIVALASNSKSPKVLDEGNEDDSFLSGSALAVSRTREEQHRQQYYRPVVMAQESQKGVRNEMIALITDLGFPEQRTKLAADMFEYLSISKGLDQVSAYWLSFELIKSVYAKSSDLDAFLDLSSLTSPGEDVESVFQDLYSFSVATLVSHLDSVDVDWRLEALALETTAFAAYQMQESFRPELMDVLYPVATFLGAPNSQLRSCAVTTLNSLAVSCGYNDVSELIIDNVDYMVNSISLKMGALEISPASTNVLRMMIRLTGPRLIPFLDDVVASIFTTLDNFHGYTRFTESLFSVLSEVVEQGAKSDVLLLEDTQSKQPSHQKRLPPATSIDDILGVLNKRAERRKTSREEDEIEEVIRSHPKGAWKSEADELLRKREQELQEAGEEAPPDEQLEKRAEPKTPTYTLLARITTLTQHYLTSPAPSLRKSLLDLLTTVAPALAPDEDAFLPLINTIWPVVVSRLHDDEPYVVIAACQALRALCASAGDFLATRIKAEWRDGLGKWFIKVKSNAAGRVATRRIGATSDKSSIITGSHDILVPTRSSHGETAAQLVRMPEAGLGRFAQAAQIWEAAEELVIAVASYVRLDDDVFDEVLDLLADTLARNDKSREALETINADAVWLAMYKRGQVEWMDAPVLDGIGFVQMEKQAS